MIDRGQQSGLMLVEQKNGRQFQPGDFAERPFQQPGRQPGAFRGAGEQLDRQPVVRQGQTRAGRRLSNRLIVEPAQLHQAISQRIVAGLQALRRRCIIRMQGLFVQGLHCWEKDSYG